MTARTKFPRLFGLLLALATLLAPGVALARVSVTFHSFSGSFLSGRYPHAFVSFNGTLDETGEAVKANYGFSAKSVGPSILNGPVAHTIYIETDRYVSRANRHFTIPVSDATYRRMVQEMVAWRDEAGKRYELDSRNCLHFVGRMAEIVGLKVDYPRELVRHPKAWLNRVATLNPQLDARQI